MGGGRYILYNDDGSVAQGCFDSYTELLGVIHNPLPCNVDTLTVREWRRGNTRYTLCLLMCCDKCYDVNPAFGGLFIGPLLLCAYKTCAKGSQYIDAATVTDDLPGLLALWTDVTRAHQCLVHHITDDPEGSWDTLKDYIAGGTSVHDALTQWPMKCR
jgi:hypothetical protein